MHHNGGGFVHRVSLDSLIPLARFEAGAVQVATNVGMPSAGSVGQRPDLET